MVASETAAPEEKSREERAAEWVSGLETVDLAWTLTAARKKDKFIVVAPIYKRILEEFQEEDIPARVHGIVLSMYAENPAKSAEGLKFYHGMPEEARRAEQNIANVLQMYAHAGQYDDMLATFDTVQGSAMRGRTFEKMLAAPISSGRLDVATTVLSMADKRGAKLKEELLMELLSRSVNSPIDVDHDMVFGFLRRARGPLAAASLKQLHSFFQRSPLFKDFNVNAIRVQESEQCPSCGTSLEQIAITEEDKARISAAVATLGKKASEKEFADFSRWMKSSGQGKGPDVVIDGLNVGCYRNGQFNASDLLDAVEYYRARGQRAVSVIKHFVLSVATKEEEHKLQALIGAGLVYVAPKRFPDDLLWVYAALSVDGVAVVSNDLLRDLHNSIPDDHPLYDWQQECQVRFSVDNGGYAPLPRSRMKVITQIQAGQCYHFPADFGRNWLCVARRGASAKLKPPGAAAPP